VTATLLFEEAKIYEQNANFPSSRYMGSKHSILSFLYQHLAKLEFQTVLDAFSGSSAVSYLLKAMNKTVTSNDFMTFSYHTANACVSNSTTRLSDECVQKLILPNSQADDFIEKTFDGLYFTREENQFLDHVTANIRDLLNSYEQSLAFAALSRACLRRRPRGLFTYTGVRYLDGRRDLQLSLEEHFKEAVQVFNRAVFNTGYQCIALNQDVYDISNGFDLVYFDPPYVSSLSDNDYTRRYHFVEGLTRHWDGLDILHSTSTKKFKRYPSLFDSKKTVFSAFERLFEIHANSTIAVSYSSNGIPSQEELKALMLRFKKKVVVHEVNHRYSFGTHGHKVGDNQNKVQEFLFIGT
jgi:DNA adenine methylase